MAKKYNCPNCGAPIGYSDKCEYCGTALNWIPMKHIVEFVPAELNMEELKVEVAMSEEQSFMNPVGCAKAVRSMTADYFAKEIVERRAYEMECVHDRLRQLFIFRSTLLVGTKRKKV